MANVVDAQKVKELMKYQHVPLALKTVITVNIHMKQTVVQNVLNLMY